MNAIYSLQPMDKKQTAKEIASLFALMGSQKQGEFSQAVAQEYLRVTSELPEWAVRDAIAMYRDGKKGDGRFVPKPPELAATARGLMDAREKREAEQARRDRDNQERREEIERRQRIKNLHAQKTPETRANVQRMLDKAKATIAANQPDQSDKERYIGRMRETQQRFAAAGRAATIKTLEIE